MFMVKIFIIKEFINKLTERGIICEENMLFEYRNEKTDDDFLQLQRDISELMNVIKSGNFEIVKFNKLSLKLVVN